MHRRICNLFLPALIAFVASPSALADVRLPGVFGDHMVLQRDAEIRVWGWADVDESVQVRIGDVLRETTAGDDGTWKVTFPAMKASKEAQAFRVTGKNRIELQNVLVGEVWLCSGQSNMEWTVRSSADAAQEIAAGDHPLIRHIKIPRKPSTVPLGDVEADWQVCSPDTVGNFTACGYFMARKLVDELDVPVGLVNSSWGGTRVEPWTPPIGFEQVPALQGIYESVIGRTPGTQAYRDKLSGHIAATREWIKEAEAALSSNQNLQPSPTFPAELTPLKSHQDPTMLFNGMIDGLVGFSIRGAIWYQGESNHGEGQLYVEKKRALIQGWRQLWEQGDFPFYYVQIAPFQYGNEDPAVLATFWEAQADVQKLPNTGMVVINDIATLNNIHPPNKQDVGLRLAMLALKNDYGKTDLVANSPEMESFEVKPNQIVIRFKNAGGGLKTRDGKPASHFEVIGAGSEGYQPATATIRDDTVTLSSEAVKNPVAFRFAWHKLAEPNLTGGTGLPVGAFRGGKEPDFSSLLDIESEYKLVYDLDLSKLAHDIKYDVDNASKVGKFDRVGYLLDLRSDSDGDQNVFVSMNAFTDDATKLGIPTVGSKAHFRQNVESMDVFSSVDRVKNGKSLKSGRIEFWPNNYAANNDGGVPKASSSLYDFGDSPGPPIDGYGCMQVHNVAAGETIFAINHWNAGGSADIGIGNRSGNGANPDWTFSGNASSYSSKRLRIYVRSKE